MPESLQGLGVVEDARFVMERAQAVAIDLDAIETVAANFANRELPVPEWNAELHFTDNSPRTANYLLVLDGLNFSFWAHAGETRWGIDYHGRALRGYWALAAALKRAIEEGHPIDDAGYMARCSESELRHILRGRGEIPLFEARLRHLHELGERLEASWGGQFVNAIATCDRSAVALTRLLLRDFPSFNDESPYAGRTVKLLKRAQILPADLWGAFGGTSWGAFDDIDRLTAFADYKVPQVLEKLGVLRYSAPLEAKLLAGVELPHHSPEEVELRAATIWGVELLRDAMARHGRPAKAIEVDWLLWEMGLHLAPEDKPYHLSRTTAY